MINEAISLNDDKAVVSLKIDKKNRVAQIEFKGQVTPELLDKTFQDLMTHRDFEQNMHACYDYSQAYPGMEMSEIEEHAQFVAKNLHRRGCNYRLALVSDDTLNYALLNVYKLLIAKTPVEAEVFKDKTEALNWIADID
jgi:hypothetical protein